MALVYLGYYDIQLSSGKCFNIFVGKGGKKTLLVSSHGVNTPIMIDFELPK